MGKPKPKLKKKKLKSLPEREINSASLGEFDFLERRGEEDGKGLAEYWGE